MQMTQQFFVFLTFLFLVPNLSYAAICPWTQEFSLGPQGYHVKRLRKGGTVQSGGLYGIRAKYDFFGPCLLYAGLEGYYGIGTLRGKTGRGDPLKSQFSELNIEGRLGITLKGHSGCKPSFTPFVGYGRFIEENNYSRPSPTHFHFRNIFDYACLGAMFRGEVNERLTLGLNVTTLLSLDGKIKVTHDPEYGSSIMHYEQKFHVRVSIPISYFVACQSELVLTPFYEFRRYGTQYDEHFDFLDTQIKIYGAVIYYRYSF